MYIFDRQSTAPLVGALVISFVLFIMWTSALATQSWTLISLTPPTGGDHFFLEVGPFRLCETAYVDGSRFTDCSGVSKLYDELDDNLKNSIRATGFFGVIAMLLFLGGAAAIVGILVLGAKGVPTRLPTFACCALHATAAFSAMISFSVWATQVTENNVVHSVLAQVDGVVSAGEVKQFVFVPGNLWGLTLFASGWVMNLMILALCGMAVVLDGRLGESGYKRQPDLSASGEGDDDGTAYAAADSIIGGQ